MGVRDFILGITRPDPDVLPVDPEELRMRLMRLNQPEAAWQVRDGTPERVDVVAACWVYAFTSPGRRTPRRDNTDNQNPAPRTAPHLG